VNEGKRKDEKEEDENRPGERGRGMKTFSE
jgi:hypothetical protein